MALVTLNRPDELNAFNPAMHHDLVQLWPLLADDRSLRSVVLTGAGRAFSAGGDFAWMSEINADPRAASRSATEAEQLISAMTRFPLPVVAAVNGPAVGLGCSLSILSDLVVAADTAHFSDPHVAIGLVAGDGGVFLPLLTGMHAAKEFLFLGSRVRATEAVAMGLANRVVPSEDLMETAIALAERLAAQPADALRAIKKALNAYASSATATATQIAVLAEQLSMSSADHGQALAALADRSRR
ncbi:enoyl-CoA hydratase/isomerase family protein [Nocardioides hungaricus]